MQFVEVEPVADDELVLDDEADVVQRDAHARARGLVQQGADAHAGRMAGGEVVEQELHGEAGVDDVLDDEDVLPLDRPGEVVLVGRLGASQVDAASSVFDRLTSTTRVNFEHLDYISSAGLGILLKTQKRLGESGQRLVLTRMNKMVRDVFRVARFDLVFSIED